MASVFIYSSIAIGSLIAGGVLTFTGMQLWDSFITRRLNKKRIPKKEDGSYDLDEMLDGGKAQINQKEVIDNERDKSRRFREYEKLRHVSNSGTVKPNSSRVGTIPTDEQSTIRRAVSSDGNRNVSESEFDLKLT